MVRSNDHLYSSQGLVRNLNLNFLTELFSGRNFFRNQQQLPLGMRRRFLTTEPPPIVPTSTTEPPIEEPEEEEEEEEEKDQMTAQEQVIYEGDLMIEIKIYYKANKVKSLDPRGIIGQTYE